MDNTPLYENRENEASTELEKLLARLEITDHVTIKKEDLEHADKKEIVLAEDAKEEEEQQFPITC